MSGLSREALSTLSNFELLELYYIIKSQVSSDSTILISFFFGYVLVAYFAGKQLSRLQASLLTLVYSVIVLVSVTSIYTDIAVGMAVGGALGSKVIHTAGFLTSGVFLAAWSLTVIYMIQVRKPQRKAIREAKRS